MAQTNFTPISLYYSATAAAVPTAGNLVAGELAINTADGKLFYKDSAGVVQTIASKAGALGDVVGPASATDNAVSRFDLTTGKLIQNSLVTISDTGAISAPVDASISGLTVGKGVGSVNTATVVGAGAMAATNTGANNTAIGFQSSNANTSGAGNTSVGHHALRVNSTGSNNTALGALSLAANTTGTFNTGVGYAALQVNTTASYNNAFGWLALSANTTGANNVAMGHETLRSNTTASSNTAVGYQAGYTGTTASENTFLGFQAGYSTTTSARNVFVGFQTGFSNTTGAANVFVGGGQSGVDVGAGYANTTGTNNTFVGWRAGNKVTTGLRNTILGGYDGNSYSLDIRTASDYIVLSTGAGVPCITTGTSQTLALEGVTPKAGTGISFSPTQFASSDANTLDDYEEGTWTPTLTPATSGSITTTDRSGTYTKVGNIVTVQGYFNVASVSSPVGDLRVGGLPFTVNATHGYGSAAIQPYGFANTTAVTAYYVLQNSNVTYFTVRGFLNGGQVLQIANNVQFNTGMQFTMTYQVA
jgi:hypothetical protein